MNFDDIERAKRIRVYRNGDEHFPGVTVTVGKRQVVTMKSLLDLVTHQTHSNEAVRRLCTPVGGTPVKHLDDVEDGAIYVAVGTRRFKKSKYLSNGIYYMKKKPEQQKNEVVSSSDVSYEDDFHPFNSHNFTPRSYLQPITVISIRVFANGKDMEPPRRILLNQHQLRSWRSVLDEITAKVDTLSGAATGLYSLDGNRINEPYDLESGEVYVAVSTDQGRFKRLNYGQTKPVFFSGTHVSHRYWSPFPSTAPVEL